MSQGLLDYVFGGSRKTQKENLWDKKNSQLKKMLEDFPWLWGISKYWCASVTPVPEVRQNDAVLKLILGTPSSSSRYSVWVIATIPCNVYNFEVCPIPRLNDGNWSAAIMSSVYRQKSIQQLVVVDPVYGEDHAGKSVTILRAEGKVPLNAIVEEVARLTGQSVKWREVVYSFDE